jgi:hypothetical protein
MLTNDVLHRHCAEDAAAGANNYEVVVNDLWILGRYRLTSSSLHLQVQAFFDMISVRHGSTILLAMKPLMSEVGLFMKLLAKPSCSFLHD